MYKIYIEKRSEFGSTCGRFQRMYKKRDKSALQLCKNTKQTGM